MAGCFGNSPYDRSMEMQLNAYLDKEAEWDNLCEKVIDCFPTDLWDSGLDNWFDTDACLKILDEGANQGLDVESIAENIAKQYTEHLIQQDANRNI